MNGYVHAHNLSSHFSLNWKTRAFRKTAGYPIALVLHMLGLCQKYTISVQVKSPWSMFHLGAFSAIRRGFMRDWQRLSRRRLVETVCVLVSMVLGRLVVSLASGKAFGGLAGRLVADHGFDVAVFSWCSWLMIIRFWAVVSENMSVSYVCR